MNKLPHEYNLLRSHVIEYTVTQISALLKSAIETDFNYVRVKGEISGFKSASSGHIYFNLKDANALIKIVCWRDIANKLNFKSNDGIEVTVVGRVTIYEGQSTYQIVANEIEHSGNGALLALLQKRKADLEAEGLFDISRKKDLPFLPNIIGIVTSPTGAVIRDIIHRISDRMPTHVVIWPVSVQGADAAEQVVCGIDGFNKLPDDQKPNVIIVARGGGSIEDLWAFNEEIVVRSVSNSNIPIISAIGHETDTTLIDYVADLRAPTPTAAAELALPVRANLFETINIVSRRMQISLLNNFNVKQEIISRSSVVLMNFSQKLSDYEYRIKSAVYELKNNMTKFVFEKNMLLHESSEFLLSPLNKIAAYISNLSTLIIQLSNNINQRLVKSTNKIQELSKLLESFDYKKILERGFTLALDSTGCNIKSVKHAMISKKFKIIFSDGEANVVINNVSKNSKIPQITQHTAQKKLF